MTSPLLALFVRSLREEARAKSTYWARAALALFILAMGAWTVVSTSGRGPLAIRAQGHDIFAGVVWLQSVAITLMGAAWFSSAITAEKEDETLGLLRMTNLDALSILLGKSTSRLASALLFLVTPFPFMVMTITLGGVSMPQVQAVYGTLLAYTFLVGNIAILWSVLVRTTARAIVGTGATLLVFLSGGEFFSALHLSPRARLSEILRTGFVGRSFGWHEAAYCALGAACFWVAWKAFPRFADRAQEGRTENLPIERIPWDEDGEWVVRANRARRVVDRETANANRLRVQGVRRLWWLSRPRKDALAWKDFHFHAGGMLWFCVRASIYGSAILVFIANDEPASARGFNERYMQFVPIALGLELALCASRLFRWELNDQTWSSLALLPLTTWQIVRRKFSGYLLALLPVLVAFALEVVVIVQEFIKEFRVDVPMRVVSTEAIFGGMVALFFAAIFTLYLIAYFSLKLRRGALPLGLLLGFVVTVMLGMAALMRLSDVFSVLGVTGVLLIGCVCMHWVLLRKASRVAGE